MEGRVTDRFSPLLATVFTPEPPALERDREAEVSEGRDNAAGDSARAADVLDNARGGVLFTSGSPLVPDEGPDSRFVVAAERSGSTSGLVEGAVADPFPDLGPRLVDPSFAFDGEALGVTFFEPPVNLVLAIFLKQKLEPNSTRREKKPK